MSENVSNLSGGYLSKPQNVYEVEPVLPDNLTKPTQIYNEEPKPEPLPEVVIAPEPTPEVVIEPVVIVEKIEQPKINPYNIRFNYNKPDGWDKSPKEKKLNIFQIAWGGITGKNMEVSDQRKFDNVVVGDGIPALIIVLMAVLAFCILVFGTGFTTEKYVESKKRNDDIFNRCINYFVDKIKHKEEVNTTTFIDTVKVNNTETYRDSIELEAVKVPVQEEIKPVPQPIVDTVVKVEEVVVKPQEPKKGFDKESLYRYYDSIKKARKN